MTSVKWIKIAVDIFDDEKIKIIESMPNGGEMVLIWFKLLTLAGKTNNNGVLMISDKVAYTDEMLATVFRTDHATVAAATATFQTLGMLTKIDGVYAISNWSKHQSADALEKKKEYDREYQRQKREEQKKVVRQSYNESYDTLISISNNINNLNNNTKDIKDTKRFKKPSIEEIKAYCEERKNGIDAQSFYDFYESKDWMIGKNKMKDFKAAIRTWERRDKKESAQKPKNKFTDFPQREYDWTDLEKKLVNQGIR